MREFQALESGERTLQLPGIPTILDRRGSKTGWFATVGPITASRA